MTTKKSRAELESECEQRLSGTGWNDRGAVVAMLAVLAAVGFTLAAISTLGQSPVISSFGQNGRLVGTDLQPGSIASVEWASSVLGPWTNNWSGLESVTVDTNGMIQVNVPMFYRVRGIPAPALGTVTFTKWITGDPNLPGLLQTLEGVVGGDIGEGSFSGEVLRETVVGDLDEVVAFYHFKGSKHSFSAIIHLDFSIANLKGVVSGVVTDGWQKGHAVSGEMKQIDTFQGHAPAFAATIEIQRDNPAPSLGKATFTKWITGDPNLPGLLQTLEGVVGGDIGEGSFSGEVLRETVVGDLDEVVAFYHFKGSKHSFSAIIHLDFSIANLKGVVSGVVTDGWLKGHAVSGEMKQIDTFQGHTPAFAAAIEID